MSIVWAAAPGKDAFDRWLDRWGEKEFGDRMENAVIEASAMLRSYAAGIVHVRSGRLKGSLSMELRDGGVSARAIVGSAIAYATIEELRGTNYAGWSSAPIAEVAGGKHSYLAKAYMTKREVIGKIFEYWLGAV